MMNNKTLGLLVLAILVMAMAAYLAQRDSDVKGRLDELVFPSLNEKLDQLNRFRITSSSTRTTLTGEKDAWVVDEKGGYPVDFEKFSTLLDGLSKARYEEKKTSRPGNFDMLELTDVDDDAGGAVLVEADAGGESYRLLIGAAATGGRGQFVRHPGTEQAWLTDRRLDVTADPADWLDPVIIDVPEDEIVRVRIETAGGDVLEAEKAGEADDMTVKGVPEGRELRYPTVGNQLARALVKVRLEDVAARGEVPGTAAAARFRLTEDRQVVVRAWREENEEENDRYFLAFDGPGSPIESWRYRVTRGTFDRFTRSMADMIKEEEAEEEAETAN